MLKRIPIYIISMLLAIPFVACNKDDKTDADNEFVYASTMVRSFSLSKNKDLLANLDTIFFSIDQVNARIFNANPLPYGTKVNKLVVDLTVDGCSVVELRYPTATGTNTVNYLKTTTDSIDFSRGPVTLHLVSYDGTSERDYQISVNVYDKRVERFTWTDFMRGKLPTQLAAVTDQRTVARGEDAFCLTGDGSSYCLAKGRPSEGDEWVMTQVNFGFEPQVRSLTAADDFFYILDTDGNLYRSADAVNWNVTGERWSYIYGGYGDNVVGVTEDGGKYYHVRYPEETPRVAVSAGMPVKATSQPVKFTTKWSTREQMLLRGGRDAAGVLTGDVFGYDGNTWTRVTRYDAQVEPVETPMMVPYFVARVDSASWVVSERSVLMSTGGVRAGGTVDDTMYISYDMGISWSEADKELRLPGTVPDYCNADALVFSTVMHSRSGGMWSMVELPPLPAGAMLSAPVSSRADKPITQWQCPMIYIFGGHISQREFKAGVYRGVVNMLTFKPVQ